MPTMNKGRGYNIKYPRFAFTEFGVTMLSGVLNSDLAIEVNRRIIRAFVTLRQLVANPPVDRISDSLFLPCHWHTNTFYTI